MDEWNRCVPWLEAALEKSGNTHTIWDVWTKLSNGEAQFWPAPSWAAVTQLADYPRKKVLRIWLAGGNLDDLLKEGLPTAYDFAQQHGCSAVEVEGRGGWAKKLKNYGFQQERILLSKKA